MSFGKSSCHCRSNIRGFVASHATFYFTWSGILPDKFVAHNISITVKNLNMEQAIGGHFNGKGTIRSNGDYAEITTDSSAMITPGSAAVHMSLMPGNGWYSLDNSHIFSALLDLFMPGIEY